MSLHGRLAVWLFSAVLGQAAWAQSLPVRVLVQSPADTKTELQVICLFRSTPENQLHGSLLEVDEKMHGELTRIRKPSLFGGESGETILLTPAAGELTAKHLLIIGLGDSATFTPERMYLVGKIALREANRLGVAHPIFASTVIDGGVTRFTTDQLAEPVVRGFLDALATERPVTVLDFSYLAGVKFASKTQEGVDRAMKKPAPCMCSGLDG